MKHTARLLLACVGITSLVAGSFAFKVKLNSHVYIATVGEKTTLCTWLLVGYKLTAVGYPTQATSTSTMPCIQTFIRTGE